MDAQLGTYAKIDTLGMSQLELILKVYDGAMKAFTAARDHYRNERLQDGYDELEKGKRFITHLYTTLDFEQGGEVARNLGKMYAFIVNEIDVIAGTKSQERLESILTMLGNMRAGWSVLRDEDKNDDTSNPTRLAPEDKATGDVFLTTA
ncbi:MAG: hypothetical protein DRP45_03445 [Candidatus Zixiibacteriota bacterium]|nr:MAG: hypothetical protein DRP45_03445 [candidate division Zixibacteria bacterium]